MGATQQPIDRPNLDLVAVGQELGLTGSACSCYSSKPSYPNYRLVARVSHPVPTSLPQFRCVINPHTFQQSPIVETHLVSMQVNQQAPTERTRPPTLPTLPSGLSTTTLSKGSKVLHPPTSPPHTYDMLAGQASILNGGADDLEVRGDEAIKRLFAKYDTFLFDVGLSLCLSLFGVVFSARQGRPPFAV